MSAARKKISVIHHLHSGGVIGFGIVTYRPGGTFGPIRQADFQLVVIHQGSVTISVDGQKHSVRKGQGILLNAGYEEFFQFSKSEETTHSWCRFPPDLATTSFSFSPRMLRQPANCSPWLLGLMRRGWTIPAGIDTPEGRRMMLGAVFSAMWDFCRAFSKATDKFQPIPEPLVKVQRVMERQFADPLTLDDLTRHAAISKGYLIKLAHKHWGTTPIERFWQIRLEEAARLLRETGLGIGEIAYRTGFTNPYHFSRRFQQRFGRYPRAWRSAVWDG